MTIEDTRRHVQTTKDTSIDREQVLRRVVHIADHAGDELHAAGDERELLLDFVRAIAAGTVEGDVAQIAKDVLTVEHLEFYRW